MKNNLVGKKVKILSEGLYNGEVGVVLKKIERMKNEFYSVCVYGIPHNVFVSVDEVEEVIK